MPVFYYKASTLEGEVVEGEASVPDQDALVRRLQDAGQIPLEIRVADGGGGGGGGIRLFGRRRLSHRDIHVFTQELATLLSAGLPLDRSLQILIELSAEPRLTELTQRILDRVKGGEALSDALEAQGVFSRFYVNMIRAGELGGSLDDVLTRLAEYLERAKALRDNVISALIYPTILVTVAVASVIILLMFVVPQFTQLFEESGRALPLPTQIVITSGEWLRSYWWMLLGGLLVAVWFIRRQLAHPQRRLRWDRLFLRLPLFGDLIAKLETARFSRTLGTLLRNGVPVVTALGIVRETLSNRVLAEGLETASENLKQGGSLSEPLLNGGLFPKLGVQMVKVGEESGQLESMLLQVAEIYDREVRTAVQRMLSLLEPMLIVSLGVVIAGIILSILMAIISVNEMAF